MTFYKIIHNKQNRLLITSCDKVIPSHFVIHLVLFFWSTFSLFFYELCVQWLGPWRFGNKKCRMQYLTKEKGPTGKGNTGMREHLSIIVMEKWKKHLFIML